MARTADADAQRELRAAAASDAASMPSFLTPEQAVEMQQLGTARQPHSTPPPDAADLAPPSVVEPFTAAHVAASFPASVDESELDCEAQELGPEVVVHSSYPASRSRAEFASPSAAPPAVPSARDRRSVAPVSISVARTEFELTELDMLRLRPFIHGVHVRVMKKRAKWTWAADSLFRRFWCLLRAIGILYFAIMIPLRASFSARNPSFPHTLVLDYIWDAFFIADFVLWSCFFSTHDYSTIGADVHIVYRARDIARHYRNWPGFIYDVVATVPVDWILIPFGLWHAILWLRLLKVVRMRNLLSSIQSIHPHFFRQTADPVAQQLVVVFSSIYLGQHWAACAWSLLRNGLPDPSDPDEDTSLSALAALYLRALYFIQCTVVTLGPGDIVAETSSEVAFVAAVMICGFVAQAALVGHLITLLKHRLGRRAWYRASLMKLKQFCLLHDLPAHVTRRLFHYYHFMWARQRGIDERQLLATAFPAIYLPDLGVEVAMEILERLPMFRHARPPLGFLRGLVAHMKPETFVPSTTVLQQGVCNTRLFLILHGTVEQILDDIDVERNFDGEAAAAASGSGSPQATDLGVAESDAAADAAGLVSSLDDKPVSSSSTVRSKSLSSGHFFGHDSFLVPANSLPYTFLSTSYVDLFSIEAAAFREVLAAYPELESKVEQYVTTMYASNEKLKSSQRVLALNNNVSARLRRIKREQHIEQMKRIFARRQKTRKAIPLSPHGMKRQAQLGLASGRGIRGVSSTKAAKITAAAALSAAASDSVWILKPHSVLHILLQSISFVAFCYLCVSLPLRFAFSRNWVDPTTFIEDLLLDYIIDAWFLVELVLRLTLIAIVDELNPHDPMITETRVIRSTYLRSNAFILDALSLLPLDFLPLFLSLHETGGAAIHLGFVCLVRMLRVLLRFHRFFHYFQSFVFALTLGFDKSGLIELNAATGGFGGAHSGDGAAGGMASDAANLLEGDNDLSDDTTDEEDSSDDDAGVAKSADPVEDGGKARRRSLTVSENSAPRRSKCATWLASLNTPHAVLSHSYHTRTALLVLRLLLLVAFFLHLSACLFFFIAKLEGVPAESIRADGSSVFAADTAVDASSSSSTGCTGGICGKSSTFTAAQSWNWAWRHHLWFNEASAGIQYLRSLLWALETATVIGVGTATPITSSEITFAFFFTMWGSALYLGLLGVLTVLVDSALNHSHAFEHSILESDHFISAQNLPSTLRLRIHSFWHYRHFLQSGQSDLEFLRALPTHLKIDVLSSLTLGILTSIPLLASIELGALEKMLVGLEPLSAGPCDVLLMEGEVSANLIMIQKGSIDVSMAASNDEEHGGAAAASAAATRMTSAAQPARDRTGTVLPVLKGGNYFNERCLLLFSPSAASYVALSFCHLFSLSRRAFDEALVDYPVFRGVIKERRTKLKQMERDRLERMRKKVERKEREQAAREAAAATTAGGLPTPPPPPSSPPSVPAPSQSSVEEATAGVAAASLSTSALSPAEIARAERKRRQHEKADLLRDAAKSSSPPPVHRRSSTEKISSASDDVSFIPTTAGTDTVTSPRQTMRNRRATKSVSYASGSRLGLFVATESDSSSDDEETRLHLLELKRRDTHLSRMEAAAESDALPPVLPPLLLGERSGFRDLELTVTRRFNKNNSVRNFLSNAERDASAEAFEAGSAVKPKEDEAQQRRAAEEAAMQQQILAMSSEHPEMASSTPTANGGGSRLEGLQSHSFAPQTVHHLQRSFTRNVLYKSLPAKMFYYAFCCQTNVFNRCFSALGRGSGSFNSLRGRVFAPTSSFRVMWNLVSLLIMLYYFLAIPFRLCIGFFPEDSALGTRGMDDRGRITHEVPADITISGRPLQFEGLIYPFQSSSAREGLFIGLWILEALMTLFWIVDLVLRCRCFPLFVHHSDGLHSIKKVATAWFPKGREPIVVQHAQHQSATHLLGRSSTTQVLGGASGATLAHTVLQARKAFLKGSSKPRNPGAHQTATSSAIVPDEPAVAPLPSSEPSTSAPTAANPASSSFDSSTLIYHQFWKSGQLKWDVLGTLPLDLALSLYSPSLGSLARVLRLARAHRIWNYVQALENFVEFHSVRINPAVLRISEQMFLLIFITHCFGVLWCLVGRFEFEKGVADTKYNAPVFSKQLNATVFNPLQVSMQSGFETTHGWMCEEQFTPVYGHVRTLSNLYLTAVYFVLAVISTTGFGDVQPHTALESGFLILLILTGCVVYSFVTANIASLAANMDVSAEEFGDRFDAVKSFSAHRHLPKPQQKKLVAYHRQLWSSSHGYDENRFLDQLPCFLKQATTFTIHEARLQSHPLFAGMEEAFLIRVSLCLRHLLCVSRQIILYEGAISLEMHFIARGSVHMISGHAGKIVEELEEGGSFNDVALAMFPMPSKSAGRRSGHGSKRSSLQTDGAMKSGPLGEIKESEEDATEGDADPAVDTAAPPTSTAHRQHPSLDSSVFPPRQLYAVVAASVSVDLYLLHRHDLMDLCKLYPVSSAEFKRRWMEKAPQDAEPAGGEVPTPFDLRQAPLGSPSSAGTSAAAAAASSSSELETHRHRRFRSTFTSPNQSPTPLNRSLMGHSQLFSPSKASTPSGSPSPPTPDRRPQLHAMPSLIRPVSLVLLPSAPGADALRPTQSAPKESTTAKFNFKAWFQGGAFVLRDTRTSRLLWNALGFLFLLLRCCVLPLFIAFTQVHVLDPSNPGARPTHASEESFWVFLALGFAVDLFFVMDLWMHVRHFAQERSWEGVHWSHYFPAQKLQEQMSAMEQMALEMRELQAKEHNLHSTHSHAADRKKFTAGSPAAKLGRKVADLTVLCEGISSEVDAPHLTVVTDSSPQAATSPKRATPALTRARRAAKADSLAAYSSLSTLPFRVDPFPSTCAEVQYAYLHQVGAWYRIPIDCIAVCPLTLGALIIMLASGSEINFTMLSLLSLNQLLLLRRLFPYLACMNAFLDRTERAYLSFQSRRILQFVTLIMLLLHWVSCIWLLLGSTNVTPDQLRDDLINGRQTDEHVTWQLLMKDGKVRSLSPGDQYLMCFYWSVAVVTTTGFGDITPTRSGEVMFTMLVILVGNVIYGAIIGAVTTATNNRAQAIATQFTNLRALTAYCKHRHVSEALTAKVLAFHKHRWRTHGSVDDAAVLAGLPPLLRGEVSFSLYGACLRQVPFFPKDDIGFLSALASLLRTQLYVSGDLVFRQGDLGRELLFLRSGRVRVFIYDTVEQGGSLRKKITLQSPIWLGEQAFFVQGLRSASVRALTHCEMLMLSDSDFQELLDAYPRYRTRIEDAVSAPPADDAHARKQPVANPTFMDFTKVLHHQKQSQSQQQMNAIVEQIRRGGANEAAAGPVAIPSAVLEAAAASSSSSSKPMMMRGASNAVAPADRVTSIAPVSTAASSSSSSSPVPAAAAASSSSPDPKPSTPVISFANLVKLLGPSPHTPPAARTQHLRTSSSSEARKDMPQHPPSFNAGPRPSIAQRSDTFQRMRES